MTNPAFLPWTQAQSRPSGSSFSIKRKRAEPSADSDNEDDHKQMRVRSPRASRRVSFPCPPDLMTDHSNSNSDSDQPMDTDHDGDMDMDGVSSRPLDAGQQQHHGDGYVYSEGGSGGFGFGPGADEDEEDMSASKGKSPAMLPSLTPHPNPHHFSNMPSPSPWSAQPFSTSLRSPPPRGLLQPTIAGPLGVNATDVERARAQHGPGCQTIPKLVLSQYADPSTGEKTMWTVCESCGACEPAR